MMKKIVTGACTFGGMILAVLCMAIFLGADYKEIFGITILQIIYLIVLMGVLLVYGSKSISDNTIREKILVRVQEEEEEDINYIVKNEDNIGI